MLAARLDLSLSEAIRRCMRLGAKFLDEVDFPGSETKSVESRKFENRHRSSLKIVE